MGNDLEKEFNIKQKPIRLPGSYSFLKFVDHPTDKQSSLVIVKEPHKVGVVASNILLPIKQIKNLGHSQYCVARCKKCLPLALFKPRSQAQMKLILWSIIKNSTQLGRIFVCNGRLMIWCEQTRSLCCKSPQQVESGKQNEKSKVFTSGLCLVNYLGCVYEKDKGSKKKAKPKTQIQTFFSPKDKKQYLQFIQRIELKLNQSYFWGLVSDGMKSLVLAMLQKQPNNRIEMSAILDLPYFANERQLKLYHSLVQELSEMDDKESIIFMETLEMVIKNRIIVDDLILQEYFKPVLLVLLEKKPDVILSALIELPNPPLNAIFWCMKKGSPKNYRMISVVLRKKQKLYNIMDQQLYDAGMSRMVFSSYESEVLMERAIHATPFMMKTIKEPNYKKQIEFLLIHKVLENKNTKFPVMLLALKCMISIIEEDLLTNYSKLYGLNYDPMVYEQELQINLHILHLYEVLVFKVDPTELISVLMPKLQPYLSNSNVTDELFFMAKKCVNMIMEKLTHERNLKQEDVVHVDYDKDFFILAEMPKPSEQEVVKVLRKQVSKSKSPHIQWLDTILENQHIIDL